MITSRVPRELYKQFETEGVALDVSNSELVALILAERYGGPAVPAFASPPLDDLLAS